MRYPIDSIGPEALPPVGAATGATPRDATSRERSFAELLAEAEAVQDHIEIRRRAPGLRGVLQGAMAGAAGFMARQTPWLALPLLTRQPVVSRHRRGR